MAGKKSPFADVKTRTVEGSDGPRKQDIVGELVVLTLTEYNDALPTQYGETTAAFCDLVVVTGKHAGSYTGWGAFGLLGKQIGEALDEGESHPARIISGTTKTGNRSWIGADFDVSAEDMKAGLKAFQAAEPAPF